MCNYHHYYKNYYYYSFFPNHSNEAFVRQLKARRIKRLTVIDLGTHFRVFFASELGSRSADPL